MARYSLFVLKVPFNTNQPTNPFEKIIIIIINVLIKVTLNVILCRSTLQSQWSKLTDSTHKMPDIGMNGERKGNLGSRLTKTYLQRKMAVKTVLCICVCIMVRCAAESRSINSTPIAACNRVKS